MNLGEHYSTQPQHEIQDGEVSFTGPQGEEGRGEQRLLSTFLDL